ncbi:Centromere/kinetochore protein zw10 [Blyttiomyces sp. JEL0837]|nr:Centromere/kinetochore protein zw10 [Blyttiomyces sp. JEL0837]
MDVAVGAEMDAVRFLSQFCESVEVHFAERKREIMLKIAREILLKEDHDVVRVGGPVHEGFDDVVKSVLDTVADGKAAVEPVKARLLRPESGKRRFGNDDGGGEGDGGRHDRDALLMFPECAVSARVVRLLELVDEVLSEASLLGVYGRRTLYQTTRDIFELFIHVMPYHHAARLDALPQACLVFHNDCMYLAHEAMTLGVRWRDRLSTDADLKGGKVDGAGVSGLPGWSVLYVDFVGRLRKLGAEWFNKQLRKQRAELHRLLDESYGFDTLEPGRHDRVDAAVRRALHHLYSLYQVLNKPRVLPTHLNNRFFGLLVDHGIFEKIISEVELLTDIAEEESHRLRRVLLKVWEAVVGERVLPVGDCADSTAAPELIVDSPASTSTPTSTHEGHSRASAATIAAGNIRGLSERFTRTLGSLLDPQSARSSNVSASPAQGSSSPLSVRGLLSSATSSVDSGTSSWTAAATPSVGPASLNLPFLNTPLFSSPAVARKSCKLAHKYEQLGDLIVLSFAEIMARWRSGVLRDFQREEMAGLIKALFADTPLRVRNLEEIRRG